MLAPLIGACDTTATTTSSKPAQSPTSTRQISEPAETKKINAKLLELERRVKHEQLTIQQASANMAIVTSEHGVSLDIVTRDLNADVERQLAMPGVTVQYVSHKYNRVTASISDLSLLHELAKIPQVVMISPQYPARTQ
jgi:hypothetical protein